MRSLSNGASYRNILRRSLVHVMVLHFGQSFWVPWKRSEMCTDKGHDLRSEMSLQLTRACSQHSSQKTCQHWTDTSGLVYTSWREGGRRGRGGGGREEGEGGRREEGGRRGRGEKIL